LARQTTELFHRRETIRFLVTSNLKASHRNKVLGHFWSLLDPLLFIGVYFFVFGILFGQTGDNKGLFVVYLSIGVLSWRFLDAAVSQATTCIRGNRGLIQEISFPKAVFPISVCFSRLYDFIWALVVLIPVVVLAGGNLNLNALWIVPLVGIHLVLVIGSVFIVAYLGAFFADTPNIVSVLMRLLMYVSPTFYFVRGKHARIPAEYLSIYMLNPIACLFESYRDALLWGQTPDPAMLAYLAVFSFALMLAGFAVFTLGEGRFAKYV
jgi:ABC-type polysaccharide/polyol phosphate export permease